MTIDDYFGHALTQRFQEIKMYYSGKGLEIQLKVLQFLNVESLDDFLDLKSIYKKPDLEDRVLFGNYLKGMRYEKGWTQTDFRKHLPKKVPSKLRKSKTPTLSWISRLENGKAPLSDVLKDNLLKPYGLSLNDYNQAIKDQLGNFQENRETLIYKNPLMTKKIEDVKYNL